MPPAQQAPTQQVQIQPGRYTYGTPVTQPVPSIPVAQVPAATLRVPSASQRSESHTPPAAQIPTPQANIGGDCFSATAWGAMYAPPLVSAQPSPGHPVVQPALAPAPVPVPARQVPVAGPSRRNTRPAVPSRLSQVYTAPSAPIVQKRRMEEDDDEIQEIPPPHKRSRK
ncbi:hypothetical protein FRC08_006547 [Ceratobasidium sp. 394]|nr:hypothetical protein FRC08_006547 [Ceratobasidium sp. 394]KAG9080660.1 hypothetical protein FS749_007941 [Ceratobasidium sp. UAMH 11750]